jgi:hypothetical protein
MATVLTGLRLNKAIHEDFKQTCYSNRVSISKVLHTLIVLFLDDNELQQRVLREANLK